MGIKEEERRKTGREKQGRGEKDRALEEKRQKARRMRKICNENEVRREVVREGCERRVVDAKERREL